MKTVRIETIPHEKQLYPTVGNYFEDEMELTVQVSDLKNPDYEFLVALHELIEQHLCKKRGIEFTDIDEYDIAFEQLRDKLPSVIGQQEPGDMVAAPYFREHQFATKIEKRVAEELGVDWETYNSAVENL